MNKVTVLVVLAAVWLIPPGSCLAGNSKSSHLRNATLTPKTRAVGVDNPCHRRKAKLTARITSAESGTARKEIAAKVVNPVTEEVRPPEENYQRTWAYLGPVGRYGPLMPARPLVRYGKPALQ